MWGLALTFSGPKRAQPDSEFAVLVLPVCARRDGLNHIPVFGNLAILDAEEVVEGRVLAAEMSFAHRQHEVALTENAVDTVVLHDDPLLGEGLKRRAETGEPIGDLRVVLDVIIAIEVACEFFHPTVHEYVLYKRSYERLVDVCLVQIHSLGRAINHGVAARVWFGWGLLQVIPVFDDEAVLEAENIEADLGAEKVIVGVRENKVTLLKHSHRVRPGAALG